MSPEQQIIEIAASIGWRCCKRDYDIALKVNSVPGTDLVGIPPWSGTHMDGSQDYHFHLLPDFLRDLNATNKMENWLESNRTNLVSDYCVEIGSVILRRAKLPPGGLRGEFRKLNCLADVKAEAFLRVMGKWAG